MGVVFPRLNRTDAGGLLIAAKPRRRRGWIEKLKPGCSSESRVFAIRFAVLLRSVGDLVLQVAGLMNAAELAQRRLVQLKQNLAELLGFEIAGCETLSIHLSQRADEGVAVLVADFAILVAVTIVKTSC